MSFFVENLYTIILIPFWITILMLLGKLFNVINSKKTINILSLLTALYCLIMSLGAFIQTVVEKGFNFETVVPFITVYKFNFPIGVYIDGISAWFLLLAAIVSILVQIYSISYMKDDKSYVRFFALLNFFVFSMFGLILSQNLFQIYIFWELVGVASYLLIGFWYKKDDVSLASRKAFIMNRIGDFSFLSGIILAAYIILSNLGNVASVSIPFSEMQDISAQIYGCTSDGIFILTCILLLLGAIAKSAQFPLNSWLIDAMKGPTPVSALIHSATMVAAGVFLLVRLYPLLSLNNIVLNFISIIGLLTAFICSYSAITQTDIKKILAYSTNAQLGLMFLAVGSCSVTVGLFHLTSHAFAKAMLFLVAGTVIYSMNSKSDIVSCHGLRKKLPICAYTFLIGIISLSGLLFSGFSSKEMILSGLVNGGHYIYAISFVIIGFMTTYYLFRLYFYIFEGKYNSDFSFKTPDVVMQYIPIVFALFVIAIWFILPKSANYLFIIINYFISIFAILLAYLVYKNQNNLKKIPILYSLSNYGFYLDDVSFYIAKLYRKLSKILFLIEKYIFDGITFLSTFCIRLLSLFFSKMQTGNVQSYISYSMFMLMLCFGGIMFVYSLILYFSEVQ